MNATAGTTVKRAILAVGAHADDLEIHAGGTLPKYHAMGYEIVYVMSTNNMSGGICEVQEDGSVTMRYEGVADMMKRRKGECDKAAAALGTKPIHLDHPQRHYRPDSTGDQRELRYGCALPEGISENIPSILTAGEHAPSINKVADLILEKNPECIITHGVSQGNIEHFATALLVTKAFWKAVDRGYEGGFLHWREAHTLHGDYNTGWETFVNYGKYLDRKME